LQNQLQLQQHKLEEKEEGVHTIHYILCKDKFTRKTFTNNNVHGSSRP